MSEKTDKASPWRKFKIQDKTVSSTRAKAIQEGAVETTKLEKLKTDEVEELLQKIDPLIEQLNNLYHMYLAGVEKRPPVERRRVLDSMVRKILDSNKQTLGVKFRASTLASRYQMHCERWDKQLRALETGKRRGIKV